MVLTEEQKELRNTKQELINLKDTHNRIKNEFIANKQICKYQEDLINKFLNILNKSDVSKNQFDDMDRY